MTTKKTEWRAEGPKDRGDTVWTITEYVNGKPNDWIGDARDESVADLFVAAPRKAALCEELVAQLGIARAMLLIEARNNRERGEPGKAEPTEGFCQSITAQLDRAGRAPQ